MGSRYLFIVLYCFIEKQLSRGDYRRRVQPGFGGDDVSGGRESQASATAQRINQGIAYRVRATGIRCCLLTARALNKMGSKKENGRIRPEFMFRIALQICSRDHRHNRFRGGILVVRIFDDTVPGRHWDEWKIIEGVEETITSGVALPGAFIGFIDLIYCAIYLARKFTGLLDTPGSIAAASAVSAYRGVAIIYGIRSR